MEEKQVALFFGAALHDIGKVVQRATGEKVRHSKVGCDFLKDYTKNKEILTSVAHHHYQEISQSKIADNDLGYITYIADNIASGVDRRESEEEGNISWDTYTNQEDIFNTFGEKTTERYYKPVMLDDTKEYNQAREENHKFSQGDYAGIVTKIKDTLTKIQFEEKYADSLLNMLEGTLSFVPSSTNTKEIADISLYDHMKLTAAIANAIYEYAKEKEITDYKEKFFEKAEEFYEEEAFLLYSFDLSGIQDFIYTIVSSGAQQQLRSRSFYLEMIAEVAVDNLLRENSLTRANLLYSGGGHAYIILPNTEFARTAIEKVGQEMNEWLMETFGAKLYFAFGYTHFCANKVMQGNDPKEYSKIFRKVSKQISEKKLHRYDAETIEKLNRGGKKEGRECRVCRSIDNLPEVDEEETSICQMCKNLEKFSKDIQKEKYFELNEQFGLEVGKNQFLKVVSEKAIKAGEVKGKIYVKNQFATGESIGTHIWVADYASEKDIGEYAKMETVIRENEKLGIRRLAVLRCDVDNLGLGFMIGFSKQNGGKFQTLSRTATFSRVMSQFFKLYMNQFAKDYEVTIVYSGGDDVFAIGQWKSVIDFAIKLDDELKTFSNHKLSLSSGIGIFGGKTPVNILAHQTGELEESAKGVDNKNGIALFSSKFTYSYELFVEKIYNEKLPFIRNFFNNQNEKGKAFIYKLLSLIRERNEKERITFARLAYFLARLEDSMKKDDKKLFKEFKEQFKTWFDDKENAEQLECAIMLYIYETRKDGEHE